MNSQGRRLLHPDKSAIDQVESGVARALRGEWERGRIDRKLFIDMRGRREKAATGGGEGRSREERRVGVRHRQEGRDRQEERGRARHRQEVRGSGEE